MLDKACVLNTYVIYKVFEELKAKFSIDITTSTFDAFDNSLRQQKTNGINFVF
jgi:hypothetical protein